VRAALLFCAIVSALALKTQESAPPKRVDWDLRAPAPVDDERVNELPRANELSCARCHPDQTREWASSRHALAWVNERYREELADKKRPEGCYGCHIPEPLHAQGWPTKPAARALTPPEGSDTFVADTDPHFAISCVSCHAGADGTILGPYGAPTDAHRSVRSEAFLPEGQSRLCIACHATNIGPVIGVAKDFVDSSQSTKGKSCVSCHMQSLERPMAREDGKPEYAPRAGRSHALQTPRDPTFLRRALRISAAQQSGAVLVTIENECGHRVPGLVEREISIDVELLDEAGAPLARGSSRIDVRNALAADGKIEVVLAGRGPRVRLKAMHRAPGFAAPVAFADEVLDVKP
jgi:hypothetical protein